MSDFLQSRIDSSQTVTRAELGTIQRTIDALYNRLNTLERRAGITGGNMVVPKW